MSVLVMFGRDWTSRAPLPECSACEEGAKKFAGEPCDGRCVRTAKPYETYRAKHRKVEFLYRGLSHVRVELSKFRPGPWGNDYMVNPRGDPDHIATTTVGRGRRVVIKTNLEGAGSTLIVRNRSSDKVMIKVYQRSSRRAEEPVFATAPQVRAV